MQILASEVRTNYYNTDIDNIPGAVAKSVEHGPRVREMALSKVRTGPLRVIVGSNPGQVKPMTHKIDTCYFLARCSALLG